MIGQSTEYTELRPLLSGVHSVMRVKSTGRPLSKVLPCPNKGSRWRFLNFPQLRDISYSNIFNVHNPGKACTESFFNLNTAHLWSSIFCWKFVFICIVLSYLTVDTAHHTHLYTVVYGSLSGWCWWERSKLARDLGHKAFCPVWLVLNEESWKWFLIYFPSISVFIYMYIKGTWQRGGFSGVFAEIGSA
jgi:hypothetical protein